MSFPIALLQDDFENGVIDALWTAAFGDTGSAVRSETSGELRITLPSSTAGTHQSGVQSAASYDLTGDDVSINVDTMVSTSVAATAALTLFDSADPTSWVRIAQLSGNLNFQKSLAGVTSAIGTAVTWNASTHKYWRIRESAGTIFLDTSSNGTSWTNRGSVTTALSFVPTAVLVRIDAVCGNVASPGSFRIDEIGATYPAPSSNWRETTADWSITNRLRPITLASDGGKVGVIVTADTMDSARVLGGTLRYFAGPLGAASGGYLALTEYASLVLAQDSAFPIPVDGRVDLPAMVDARFIRLYHRSVDASAHTVYEFVPRRMVQADDIEAESIRAINIAARAITADRIAAHTITASEIGTVNLDATARITAAGGDVTIDDGGIVIVAPLVTDTDHAYTFADSLGADAGGLYGSVPSGLNNIEVQANALSGRDSRVELLANAGSSDEADIILTAARSGSGQASFAIARDPFNSNWGHIFEGSTSQVLVRGGLTVGASPVGASLAQGFADIKGGLNVGTATGAGTGQIATSGNAALGDSINSVTRLRIRGASATSSDYALVVVNNTPAAMLAIRNDNRIGFFGATEVARPTVTGSRGGNAALASLLTALANLGLITDSSS